MGAKTWMLVYSNGNPVEILKAKPQIDREASAAFAKTLFPSDKLESIGNGSLTFTCPPDDELVVGCFHGLSIIAAKEFGIDYPSRLSPAYIGHGKGQTIYLHAMHSVVDWFAFAVWKNGQLKRSLSLSPDSGVLEDIGQKLPFEEPFWAGQHPAIDPDEEGSDYPFPFHPLELGEAALVNFFGYQLEGGMDPSHLDSEEVPLLRFKRAKPWWKVW